MEPNNQNHNMDYPLPPILMDFVDSETDSDDSEDLDVSQKLSPRREVYEEDPRGRQPLAPVNNYLSLDRRNETTRDRTTNNDGNATIDAPGDRKLPPRGMNDSSETSLTSKKTPAVARAAKPLSSNKNHTSNLAFDETPMEHIPGDNSTGILSSDDEFEENHLLAEETPQEQESSNTTILTAPESPKESSTIGVNYTIEETPPGVETKGERRKRRDRNYQRRRRGEKKAEIAAMPQEEREVALEEIRKQDRERSQKYYARQKAQQEAEAEEEREALAQLLAQLLANNTTNQRESTNASLSMEGVESQVMIVELPSGGENNFSFLASGNKLRLSVPAESKFQFSHASTSTAESATHMTDTSSNANIGPTSTAESATHMTDTSSNAKILSSSRFTINLSTGKLTITFADDDHGVRTMAPGTNLKMEDKAEYLLSYLVKKDLSGDFMDLVKDPEWVDQILSKRYLITLLGLLGKKGYFADNETEMERDDLLLLFQKSEELLFGDCEKPIFKSKSPYKKTLVKFFLQSFGNILA